MGNRGNFETTEPSTFVGRGAELAELRAALDDAAAGRGRLLLISGEPGIGKTRLADEFNLIAASQGARVAWGRCWEGAGAPAYWAWIRLIRSMSSVGNVQPVLSMLIGGASGGEGLEKDDESDQRHFAVVGKLRRPQLASVTSRERVARIPGHAADPEQTRFRLFSSVAQFLKDAARACPVALIVDDIHDADQSSLLMLQFVARELRDAHVVIVATFREAEVERSKTLGPLIARIAREGTLLPLRGLVEPDIAEFVSTRCAIAPAPGLITMLHRATDGNPLFLEGVVRMLVVEGKLGDAHETASSELKLPAGVRIAIRKQVGSLSEAAQAMLSIASALGNEFDFHLLERVAAPGETSGEEILQRLDESLAAGILIRDQGSRRRYRFAHALIRATIYDALSATERIHSVWHARQSDRLFHPGRQRCLVGVRL